MKMTNPEGDGVELPDFTGIVDEPDTTIYEITIKVYFYENPDKNIIDYLDLTAEDVILMFQQFKAGGFLPSNCRVIMNTALVKEFLSGIKKEGREAYAEEVESRRNKALD